MIVRFLLSLPFSQHAGIFQEKKSKKSKKKKKKKTAKRWNGIFLAEKNKLHAKVHGP